MLVRRGVSGRHNTQSHIFIIFDDSARSTRLRRSGRNPTLRDRELEQHTRRIRARFGSTALVVVRARADWWGKWWGIDSRTHSCWPSPAAPVVSYAHAWFPVDSCIRTWDDVFRPKFWYSFIFKLVITRISLHVGCFKLDVELEICEKLIVRIN